MTISAEHIAELLHSLYAAAAQPERYNDFLESLRTITGSSRAYLMMHDSRSGAGITAQSNWDPHYAKLYAEQYANDDPVFANAIRAMRRNGGDWAGDRTSILTDAQYFKHPSYHDMLVPVGDLHMVGSMMEMPGGALGSIVLRRQRNHAAFEPEIISLIRLLGPHLKQALHLHSQFETERARSGMLASATAAFSIAVIALDAQGCVLDVSDAASAILRQGGLTLRGRHLAAEDLQQNFQLQQLLAGAATTAIGDFQTHTHVLPVQRFGGASRVDRTPAFGGAMHITRPRGLPLLKVTVVPFTSEQVLTAVRPAMLVFLHDPGATPVSRGEVMRALYGITPTQVRLADLLLVGNSVREAAEAMNIAEDTARYHLKSIFRTTRIANQGELLRLMLSLPGVPPAALRS